MTYEDQVLNIPLPESYQPGSIADNVRANASRIAGRADARIAALEARVAGLVAALKGLMAAAPAFRVKLVGAEGSEARDDQNNHIAAEDAARVAIAKAEGR